MNYEQELNNILNDGEDKPFQGKVITLLEELRESVETSHDRFWTLDAPPTKQNDIFNLKEKPLDVLKAVSFDDTLTMGDRFVLTIIYNTHEITTDQLLKLTGMSVGGLRRIVNKLTQESYIIKIKNGLYKSYDKKIF